MRRVHIDLRGTNNHAEMARYDCLEMLAEVDSLLVKRNRLVGAYKLVKLTLCSRIIPSIRE
jgi:hypothetical protein